MDRERVIGVGMGLPAPIDRATGAVQAVLDPPRAGSASTRPPRRAPARAAGPGRERRQPRRARGARLGRREGQVRGRLHQGLLRNRRRADLRRPPPARRRRDRRRDRPHRDRRGRAGLPMRQPGLPRDARLLAGDRGAAQREPRRGDLDRRLLELLACRRRGDRAPDRRCRAGDRGRGREPLQPAQPGVRDRRRRPERRRRGVARAAARLGSPQRDPERRPSRSRSSAACSESAPSCSARWRW